MTSDTIVIPEFFEFVTHTDSTGVLLLLFVEEHVYSLTFLLFPQLQVNLNKQQLYVSLLLFVGKANNIPLVKILLLKFLISFTVFAEESNFISSDPTLQKSLKAPGKTQLLSTTHCLYFKSTYWHFFCSINVTNRPSLDSQ